MNDFNYFGDGEKAAQKEFQTQRDRVAGPLVGLLIRLHITPNVVSALGMAALAPFAYFVLTAKSPQTVAFACGFLLIHVALDGLDGPLARRMGLAGAAGAFVDMCCDHGGAVIVVWILSAARLIDGTAGNVYVFLYTIAILFIVWLNALGQPFRFVFRSKYFLYSLIFVLGWIGTQENPPWKWLDYALWAFSAANLPICIIGFTRVYCILSKGPESLNLTAPPLNLSDAAGKAPQVDDQGP